MATNAETIEARDVGSGAVARSERAASGDGAAVAVSGAVMHASIVHAICRIQTSLEAVKKSQRNQHGGYQFASTDDIYAALTKKMGEVGLVSLATEEHTEVVRVEKEGKNGEKVTSQWLKATFGFVLATEQATYQHPSIRRTLYIQVTGPQTFQAAQSYAEKSFLRSLFKLPTGDMDLDSLPQADNEEDQVALNGPKGKRKSSAEGKRDVSVAKFNGLMARIEKCDDRETLLSLRMEHMGADGSPWADMPTKWHEMLEDAFVVRIDDLGLGEIVA